MQISERLKSVINKVEPCDLLADIGTDHAFVPITLIKRGTVKRVIACDISKGSIEKAEENVTYHNCTEFIDCRLGDGLTAILPSEFPECIVVSGMGGMLTIDVLNSNLKVVDSAKRLILQPQRDIDKVRRFIHSRGFMIIDENMMIEDEKYYNIIVCEHGNDVYYSYADYLLGKILIENKNDALKSYMNHEIQKMNKALSCLDSSNHKKRKLEIEKKLKVFREVYKAL